MIKLILKGVISQGYHKHNCCCFRLILFAEVITYCLTHTPNAPRVINKITRYEENHEADK